MSSQAAVIGSTVFDAKSSWGNRELNPALTDANGRFGRKGVALKAGVATVLLLGERPVIRKWPASRRVWIAVNFIVAGAISEAAVQNYVVCAGGRCR